jgi:signal transduction histidine kinase
MVNNLPSYLTEDEKRRAIIFTYLLIGLIGITVTAFLTSEINLIVLGPRYGGAPPWMMLLGTLIFLAIFYIRISHQRTAALSFIGLIFILGTIPLILWGIILPEGLLMYVITIIMAGILISSSFAILTAGIISASLITIQFFHNQGLIKPDLSWLTHSITYMDAIMFGISFGVIALVTWLSNREVEKSLWRARTSEAALRDERNSLEVKVVERTKQLEQAQLEQMLQLQRFAEFGRLSSGLVHDLANPLTAVSLNLEQIGDDATRSEAVKQTKLSLKHIEQYVEAARKQLQNQSEIRWFTAGKEIEQVAGILEYKASRAGVGFEIKGDMSLRLYGDPVRFSQVISNLMANAIDAYDGTKPHEKRVLVRVVKSESTVIVVVHDWGAGIPKRLLKQVFEPFYTTKSQGRGIGIGLMMTKQIIEELGGSITVNSSRQKGTEFTVVLPIEIDGRHHSTSNSART